MFGSFSKKKRNTAEPSVDRMAILFSCLDEELDEIERSDNPHGFFIAYKKAIDICAEILSKKPGEKIDNQILKTLHYLYGNKTEITNRFLDRSSTSGRLSYDLDIIVSYKAFMTDDSYDYFLSMTGIDNLVYTYCKVTFGGSQTYDYICEIPDISIGDDVIVPVGDEDTEKFAKVTAINEYRYDEAPYPVAKTKKIIAKYGCGL